MDIDIHRPAFYPKQFAAVYDKARYSLIEASTKAGKTSACIAWLTERAFHGRDGQNFWWVAPVSEQARIAFNRTSRALGPDNCRAYQSPYRVALPHGAIIWFKSGDKPDSLYGEDVYAAVIDEASRLKENAWYALRSTLTFTRAPARIIGNVHGRKNWFYQMARKAEHGFPNYAYHRLIAHDAVEAGVLAAEEIEAAQRELPEHVFKELYLAEASEDGGNPFGFEAIKRCTVPTMYQGTPAVFGIDLAKSVDWTVVIGMTREGYVCKMERWQHIPWEDTVNRILAIIGRTPTLVDSTGVGDPIVETLQRRTNGHPDSDHNQVEGYQFSSRSKQQLMEGLALAIQSGGITFPPGPITMELEQFTYEMRGKEGRFTGVSYTAPAGFHDDCLLPGTLIKTSTGYHPIETIKPGDLVLTHAGRYRPVEHCIKKVFDGDLWRMKFQSCIELAATYNHPIYRASRSYLGDTKGPWVERAWTFPAEWKKTYRAVSAVIPLAVADEAILPNDLGMDRVKTGPNRWPINEEAARFLGRFLADGHCRRTGGFGLEIAFDRRDKSIEAYRRYLGSLGIVTGTRGAKGNSIVLCFSSHLLWTALCMAYSPQRDKVLPPWAMKMGQFMPAILEGWLDGDGWRHPRGYRIGATTSKALGLDMRDIAHSSGYATSFQAVKRHRYGKPNKQQFWLTVQERNSQHRAKLTELGDVIFPLSSMRSEHYRGIVYNLQVAEDRSFVADGLIVHNCVMALALAEMHRHKAQAPMVIPAGLVAAIRAQRPSTRHMR